LTAIVAKEVQNRCYSGPIWKANIGGAKVERRRCGPGLAFELLFAAESQRTLRSQDFGLLQLDWFALSPKQLSRLTRETVSGHLLQKGSFC
jgi:hypothetical protein